MVLEDTNSSYKIYIEGKTDSESTGESLSLTINVVCDNPTIKLNSVTLSSSDLVLRLKEQALIETLPKTLPLS
jgi:hypothetical protein